MLSRKSRKKKGKNPEPGWLTRLARGKRKFVAHVRLKGAIGMERPFSPSMSMAGIEDTLETAFAIPGIAAVAFSINSPGGSPVQSTLIFSRIRQLSEETGVKVLVFCEDVAASGGYLLAVAGDEVFADRTSIVGSIGVISAGFGFTGAIKKLGVERRVYTAGTNKSVLDPFLPEKKEDVDHLKSLQLDVHEAFKDIVRARRAEKLKGDEKELFSGLFWSGDKAMERGLVDGIGSLHTNCTRGLATMLLYTPWTPAPACRCASCWCPVAARPCNRALTMLRERPQAPRGARHDACGRTRFVVSLRFVIVSAVWPFI